MFSRTGAAALKMDLSNTLAICEYLKNPEKNFPAIHIAGTNGKGSVSHMLASIFQEAGYKTGLYTSPHLYDFRERIKINGEMIPKEDVIHFTEKMKPLIELHEPSFFEVTVGMAFDFFSKQQVDIAIIETGLGGRLDSTNIIQPILSVITNIGLDHTQLLGDSREKIAREKAGIIKKNIPVIIGRTQDDTKEIFIETAVKSYSPIVFADENYFGKFISFKDGISKFEFNDTDSKERIIIESDLAGAYQSENIITVITALRNLKKSTFNISSEKILSGIHKTKKNTGLMGRWDMIRKRPYVFLDVGHNEDGIKKVLEQVELFPHKNLYFILGMSKDKDVQATLELLPKHANYYFAQAHLPRALEASELKRQAEKVGLKGVEMEWANDALEATLSNANEDDLIVICGSIFVVAEIDREKFDQ